MALLGSDDLGRIGAAAALNAARTTAVVPPRQIDAAGVVVVVSAHVGLEELAAARAQCDPAVAAPVVVVANRFVEHDLLPAVAGGLAAVLPRQQLRGSDLVAAVLSVSAGATHLPPRLQGTLSRHLRRLDADVLAPRGVTLSGLTRRECEVLRLVGAGLTTAEVAARLRCSERTVKHDVAEVMRRHGLRTRAQAVAHAVRTGAI